MRVLLIALLIAACGDNTPPRDPLFIGLSGSRIKLQWYLYQDGSKQLETAAFYDAQLHTRCAPAAWVDGVTRCTPLADTTVFRDADCTMELGHATTARTPKFFVREEVSDGKPRLSHLFRAGPRIETAPAQFFVLRDGTCTQIAEPVTVAYFEIATEIDVVRLAEVWSEMIEGERLGLRTIASVEGLSAPLGFHDQQLGLDCRPADLADGTSACVPTMASRADYFSDHYCEVPVVIGDDPPAAIELDDPNGCTTYHAPAADYVGFVYQRTGNTCALVGTKVHAYRIGAPLALAPIERARETARGKRLQRITVLADGKQILDGRLFDTATRGECHSFGNGELASCIPASALDAARVFANDKCTREVLVADVPARQCERSKFAVAEGLSIHAIGEPVTTPLYTLDASTLCRPRAAPLGHAVPHLLGPPVPPETFVAGVVFSER